MVRSGCTVFCKPCRSVVKRVNDWFLERWLFMKMLTMFRMSLATLAPVALFETKRAAQFITAGSTPEGDYLRGVGIADWGMGLYNLNTAQANSINTDTEIRWNEYLGGCRQATDQRIRGA